MSAKDFFKIFKKLSSLDLEELSSELGNEVLDRDRNIELIADDYLRLIKSVLKLKNFKNVRLNQDDILAIDVDGTEYCFYTLVRHNDGANTELMMEIETLFADGITVDEVQNCLNQKLNSHP